MPKNNRHGQAAILSDSDYAKIFKHLTNPKHRLLLFVARYTGERWGAIVQLRIKDVYRSPERGVLQEAVTFRASTRKASPTGKQETRQVPFHPNLAVALQAYRPESGLEWLFPDRSHRDRHMSMRNADNFFRIALEKAGLGDRGISTHSTRRTFITRLSQTGTDVRVIQKITGHHDLKSLQRYIEVSEGQVKEALCRI